MRWSRAASASPPEPAGRVTERRPPASSLRRRSPSRALLSPAAPRRALLRDRTWRAWPAQQGNRRMQRLTRTALLPPRDLANPEASIAISTAVLRANRHLLAGRRPLTWSDRCLHCLPLSQYPLR